MQALRIPHRVNADNMRKLTTITLTDISFQRYRSIETRKDHTVLYKSLNIKELSNSDAHTFRRE